MTKLTRKERKLYRIKQSFSDAKRDARAALDHLNSGNWSSLHGVCACITSGFKRSLAKMLTAVKDYNSM